MFCTSLRQSRSLPSLTSLCWKKFPSCSAKSTRSYGASSFAIRRMSNSTPTFTVQMLPCHSKKIGLLELNNPKALNALNSDMVRALKDVLGVWQPQPHPDSLKATYMFGRPSVNKEGKTKPVFCAGGDVKSAYLSGKNDEGKHGWGEPGLLTADFFREEYNVNHMIATQYERTGTPQVAIWDGIVMGGGVGLSIHGTYRVASENTMFAMPETGIGLFPDVGGLWALSRLEPYKGMGAYLALTGERVHGMDCVKIGLATHYVHSKLLDNLQQVFVDSSVKTLKDERMGAVGKEFDASEILSNFHETSLKDWNDKSSVNSIESKARLIRTTFHKKESVEHVMDALKEMSESPEDAEPGSVQFATETFETLLKRSPTSLKITFEGMKRALTLDTIGEELQMEYRLSQACMRPGSDFYEGIRSVLIDRDNNPKWDPATLEGVTDDMVESYFQSLGEHEWQIPRYQKSSVSGSKL
jgi:enoyl-CoA hydratase/carnithine racemase